jgi:hypothetical protein
MSDFLKKKHHISQPISSRKLAATSLGRQKSVDQYLKTYLFVKSHLAVK